MAKDTFLSVFLGSLTSDQELEDYIRPFLDATPLGKSCHHGSVFHFFGSPSEIFDDIGKYALHSSSYLARLRADLEKNNQLEGVNSLYIVYDHKEPARKGTQFDRMKYFKTYRYDHRAPEQSELDGPSTDKGVVSIWFGTLNGKTLLRYVEWRSDRDPGVDTTSLFQKDFGTGYYDLDYSEQYVHRTPASIDRLLDKTGFSDDLKKAISKKARTKKLHEGKVLLALFDYDYSKRQTSRAKPAQSQFKFVGTFSHVDYS